MAFNRIYENKIRQMKHMLILIGLMAVQLQAFPQEEPEGHIVVCGRWEHFQSMGERNGGSKVPAVVLYDKHLIPDFMNHQTSFNVIIERDSFHTRIPLTKNLQYIRLAYFGGSARGFPFDPQALSAFYLVQDGDSLHISRYAQRPISLASDSPLLRYQIRLFSSISNMKPNVPIASVQLHMEAVLKSMNSDIEEGRVPDDQSLAPGLRDLVRKNFMSYILTSACRRIYISILSACSDSLYITDLERISLAFLPFETVTNDSLLNLSKHVEFLFYLNSVKGVLQARLSGTETTDHLKLAEAIYATLLNNYSGYARDKLLEMFFKWSVDIRLSGKTAVPLMQEALSAIEDQNVRRGLSDKINGFIGGEEVPDYEFFDRNGNIVRLSDYRDKIIMAHFWFLGCVPCMEMTRNLSPLIEELADHTDMVFLNINVDKNGERWKAGLDSEKYSHEGEILLNTGSIGMSHPLLKHYGYIGMPSVLLVDAEGKLISSNPPKADSPESYKALQKLLLNHLNALR